VWRGRKRKIVEETTTIDEAARSARIRLVLRACGDYSLTPANIPLPVERDYVLKFPALGKWTVSFNDTNTKVIVQRGAWRLWRCQSGSRLKPQAAWPWNEEAGSPSASSASCARRFACARMNCEPRGWGETPAGVGKAVIREPT